MWTPARFALLCGAAIAVCSSWVEASRNELEDSDLSYASPFDFSMSARGGGGLKCSRAKKCGSKGGECVPIGSCTTLEMNEKCSKKNGGKCVCCAQDKKFRCKAFKNRPCLELGGFCVKKKEACAQGYLLPGECNCEGKDPKAKRGHCCLRQAPPPPPTQPPPPPATEPPPPPATEPPPPPATEPPPPPATEPPPPPATEPPTPPATEPPTPPPTSCVSPWVLVGEECYQLLLIPNINWYDAREECKKIDGDLAVLDTQTKQLDMTNFLKDQFSSTTYVWLGGNNLSGSYTWVSGGPVTSGWNVNAYEPDSYEAGNCIYSDPLYVEDGNHDLLFDLSCTMTHSLLNAVCQK